MHEGEKTRLRDMRIIIQKAVFAENLRISCTRVCTYTHPLKTIRNHVNMNSENVRNFKHIVFPTCQHFSVLSEYEKVTNLIFNVHLNKFWAKNVANNLQL